MGNRSFIVLLVIVMSISAQLVTQKDIYMTNLLRRNSHGWTAGDGTMSMQLPGNHNFLWIFQDSYIEDVRLSDTTVSCLFQVHNAMMIQTDTSFRTLFDSTATGIERSYFKDTPYSTVHHYWPNAAFLYGDTIWVFAAQVQTGTLTKLGNYYGKIHYPDFKFIGMYQAPVSNSYNWGVHVLFDTASGYFLVYGQRGVTAIVARFKPGHVQDNWEFYTGSGWSTVETQAGSICSGGMGGQFGVVKRKTYYYLFTQQQGGLMPGGGRTMYVFSGTSPTGPFANQRTLYTMTDMWDGEYLTTYNGMPHDGIYKDSISFSYNVNGNDSTCKTSAARLNADCYRPKFIACAYSILNPADKIEQNLIPWPAGSRKAIEVTVVPRKAALTISFESMAGGPAVARIFDLCGREILTRPLLLPRTGAVMTLDLSAIPNGMYESVIICGGNAVRNMRFVKLQETLLIN